MSEAKREALWLAEKMGLQLIDCGADGLLFNEDGPAWEPHTNKAQWAECPLWAVKHGYVIHMDTNEVAIDTDSGELIAIAHHNNTDASIMAATLKAICLATGYKEAP